MCFGARFSGNLGLESIISGSKVQANGPTIPKFPYKHFDTWNMYMSLYLRISTVPAKLTIDGALKSSWGVVVSSENDTCSVNGLVMGYADCKTVLCGFC